MTDVDMLAILLRAALSPFLSLSLSPFLLHISIINDSGGCEVVVLTQVVPIRACCQCTGGNGFGLHHGQRKGTGSKDVV